uniref:SCR protein n=1 Tax=Capsella grandiflora TaxID=264402 RepID=A0A509EMI8_9BRAS|nr:SCR [Capsella grandiflora]
MRCVVLFMVSCLLLFLLINQCKEVEAQKWKPCFVKDVFPGKCEHDVNAKKRCKEDIAKNEKLPRPFECDCQTFDRGRVCYCTKCLA